MIEVDEVEDGGEPAPPTDNCLSGTAALVTLRLHDSMDASDDSQTLRHTA